MPEMNALGRFPGLQQFKNLISEPKPKSERMTKLPHLRQRKQKSGCTVDAYGMDFKEPNTFKYI